MIAWKGYIYDPLELRSDGWYYYDETWADVIGPFHSRMIAAAELKEYAELLSILNEFEIKYPFIKEINAELAGVSLKKAIDVLKKFRKEMS